MIARPPAHSSSPLADDLRTAYVHHRAGRLDKAEALYRKVLRRLPHHPDALNLLGLIALDRGRPDEAVRLIGEAVRVMPTSADAHSNLGSALIAAGKTAKAIQSYRRAIELKPGFAAGHSNLGRAYNTAADFAAAVESSRTAIVLDPSMPEPHYNLAFALRGLSRLAESEAACRVAVRLKPADIGWAVMYATILAELDRSEEALAILDRLIGSHPDNAVVQLTRASVLYRLGDVKEAEAGFRRTTTLAPDNAEAWNGLGRAERAQGRFAAAADFFRRALAVAPGFADAYRNLALVGQIGVERTEGDHLVALLTRQDIPDIDRVAAGFALGKILDDAARYDEAIGHYRTANALFRTLQQEAGRRYDATALTQDVEKIIAACSAENLAALERSGVDSDVPVFIVGMPRSGTSLVEQILASHPRVFGAGELKDIGRLVTQLGGRECDGTSWQRWDRRMACSLAETHLSRLKDLGGDASRVIDKMPDNIFMLGAIAALFPAARVVFCRRDPRDTCLSCYFTLFSSGNLFSYDLADCAHRQIETDRLLAYWQQVLPLRMHVVDYEALVSNFEVESRRLIGFLDLDWDAACLDFHRTERTVVTASSWQVRQPLFDRSIGRWRHYAPHLDALSVLG